METSCYDSPVGKLLLDARDGRLCLCDWAVRRTAAATAVVSDIVPSVVSISDASAAFGKFSGSDLSAASGKSSGSDPSAASVKSFGSDLSAAASERASGSDLSAAAFGKFSDSGPSAAASERASGSDLSAAAFGKFSDSGPSAASERASGSDPYTAASAKAVLTRAIMELDEYFAGVRTAFDLPLMLIGTDFQKSVWTELLRIPYGHTTSYASVAQAIGRPSAVRAVAHAIGSNPLSILIPCHRVIGSDGSLTGYAGGLEAKRFLLRLEGVHIH